MLKIIMQVETEEHFFVLHNIFVANDCCENGPKCVIYYFGNKCFQKTLVHK